MKMGLEQYAGMSNDQKLIAVLVKMDNFEGRFDDLEDRINAKPCPSPDCLECRKRITTLEEWRVKREAVLATEDKVEDKKEQKNSWFWPMVVMSALTLVGFCLGMTVS